MGIYLNPEDRMYDPGPENYPDNLLPAAIDYDTKTKTHPCKIEKYHADQKPEKAVLR